MNKGLLIVFEGIDGSGKTTQSKRLQQTFLDRGQDSVWFREPGDSPSGRRIRELAMTDQHLSPEDELALFVEDRRENVRINITPNLMLGNRVILDRYYFSSACYQGARGMDPDAILALHAAFAPRPDLALYIDVDVQSAIERISRNRSERAIRFEVEEYLEKVRSHYLRLCEGGHLLRIDGQGDEDQVFDAIIQLCGDLLRFPR